MDFEKTGLPDRPLFRAAFAAGWEKHLSLQGDERAYLRGPAAMARLVIERGGDCRQVVAAACLAGPAVFSTQPDLRLDKKIIAFAREIMDADFADAALLPRLMPMLSADARLFLQVSAILLIDGVTGREQPGDLEKTWTEALHLYSAARGSADLYRLDTRFEIAAMKVTTFLDDRSHLWVRSVARASESVRI